MESTPRAIYNLGSGRKTTVGELIATLISRLGLPADYPVKELEGTNSDQQGVRADVTAIREDLDWTTQTRLDEGIGRMIDWARQAI